MMKWKTLFTLALFAVVTLACSDGQQGLLEPDLEHSVTPAMALLDGPAPDLPTFFPGFPYTDTDPFTADLIADGGFDGDQIAVGEVQVWNDAENLYVKYVIDDSDWCLTGTHVAALGPDATWDGTGYANKNLNPKVGMFPHGETFTGCESEAGPYVFGLNADEIPGYTGPDAISVAAHAGVKTVAPVEEFDGQILASDLDDDPDNTTLMGGRLAYAPPSDEGWSTYPVSESHPPNPAWADMSGYSADWLTPNGVVPPEEDTWWLFQDAFSVPENAENLSGVVKAISDNAEEVWFGGELLPKNDPACNNGLMQGTISEDDKGAFKEVCQYDFSPLPGANGLDFVVRNYAGTGANPVSLAYAVDVSYEIYRYESAWALGTQFNDSKSWAEYFGYSGDIPPTYTCPAPDLTSGDNVAWIIPPAGVLSGVSEAAMGQLFAESVFIPDEDIVVDEGAVPGGNPTCSYYLHADAVGSGLTRVAGTARFVEGAEILGIAYTGSEAGTNAVEVCKGVYRLYDTDIYGAPSTDYPIFEVQPHRGLECGGQDGTPDFLSDPPGVNFSFDLGVAEATDGIRFFLTAVEVGDGS